MSIPDFPGRHNSLEIVEEFYHQMFLEDLEDHCVYYNPDLGVFQGRYYGESGLDQCLLSCQRDSLSLWVNNEHLMNKLQFQT